MTRFLNRETDYPIEPFFLSRVSYRAFSDESIRDEELMTLFEAARWAPSSYNNQPWRFIYARKNDPCFETLYTSLIDFNKQWCKRADTLVLVVSRNRSEHNEGEYPTSKFDTGSAWMSLALQASMKGIVAHGMAGFDGEYLKKQLNIPDSYTIDMMFALGKHGAINTLPQEMWDKETPSLRKPLNEIISRGTFSFS